MGLGDGRSGDLGEERDEFNDEGIGDGMEEGVEVLSAAARKAGL